MKIISIDMDGVLTRPSVRDFIKSNNHRFKFIITTRRKAEGNHPKLMQYANECGITHINFTNGMLKADWFAKHHIFPDYHVDDEYKELKRLEELGQVLPISIWNTNWQHELI